MERGEIKGKWGHDGNTRMSMCVFVSFYVRVFKGLLSLAVTPT